MISQHSSNSFEDRDRDVCLPRKSYKHDGQRDIFLPKTFQRFYISNSFLLLNTLQMSTSIESTNLDFQKNIATLAHNYWNKHASVCIFYKSLMFVVKILSAKVKNSFETVCNLINVVFVALN